ncbi:hypothetical protein [Ferrovibrio sp.]
MDHLRSDENMLLFAAAKQMHRNWLDLIAAGLSCCLHEIGTKYR